MPITAETQAPLVLVLVLLRYQPYLLIRPDQMVDTGCIAKSTYFSFSRHTWKACCRAAIASFSARLSCSQPSMGSLAGLSIPFQFLDCCWHRSGPCPD